jgi:phosphoglycerate dehydrogenase-like enzyme
MSSPATRHFLSTEEFEVLSKHPPLISNIARGAVIDQPALIDALNSGKVAAAALDVTEPEPLPEGDPLWTTPNVIVTPHISGSSTNYQKRTFEVLEQNLVRLDKGEKLLNVVSRRKGYWGQTL